MRAPQLWVCNGFLCNTCTTNVISQYQQDSSANPPQFAKFNIKDVINMIEADNKDEYRYLKRWIFEISLEKLIKMWMNLVLINKKEAKRMEERTQLYWTSSWIPCMIVKRTSMNFWSLIRFCGKYSRISLVSVIFIQKPLQKFIVTKFFIETVPQTRFLSPRLGRTSDGSLTHHLPSLPPRFGKRNTVFTPRMG